MSSQRSEVAFLSAALTRWAGRLVAQLSRAPRDEDSGPAGLSSPFEALISAAAARHGLPASLIRAVIQVESGFNPQAVSPAGAKGLMQLMDGTGAELGVTNPFDPAQNIEAGAAYLKKMLNEFGSLPLALAAYNAGPGAVARYRGIPPYAETLRYVERVLGLLGCDKVA